MAGAAEVSRPGLRAPRTGFRFIGRLLAPIREARGVGRAVFWVGLLITVVFIVLAVAAPLISPYDFDQYRNAAAERFPKQAEPSLEHLFGTTVQSTDVLARVIYGASTAINVVLLSVVFALVIGLPIGLISGYFGGWLDRVLLLIMDAMFAFPYLLLAIVISFLLSGTVGKGIVTASMAISVVYVPQYYRVVRNHVISVREEPYVEAARALGARPRTVISRYVLANVIQSVPVVATLNAADAILTLAALGFLGYGIQPTDAAEWGYDISRALSDAGAGIWWTGLYPGLAIVTLVTGLTLLGEGLNDLVNPLLRRRPLERVTMPGLAGAVGTEPAPPPEPEATHGEQPTRRALAEALAEAPAITIPTAGRGRPADELKAGELRELPVHAGRDGSVRVRDLRVWYGARRGVVRAVDGISFEIKPGETLGLVGESGCGKSTVARALLGLLPRGATAAGEIWYGGRNLVGASPRELRNVRGAEIGLIFQEPMTRLDPLMRIRDHFRETLRAHEQGISNHEIRQRSLEALGGMGIPPTRFDQYPHEFSGGMRQRIMIALALVLRPRLLIADEPTTALDVIVEAQILQILRDLQTNFNTSLLLITHNLGIVTERCDRVAVMYAGRLAEQGDAYGVLRSPQHPYTQELLRSIVSLKTTALNYIPGSPPDLTNPPTGCRFHPRCPRAMEVCPLIDPVRQLTPAGSEVWCWLHGPDELIPDGGSAPLQKEELAVADEA
jgi:peptide/nickel transport system permease protein